MLYSITGEKKLHPIPTLLKDAVKPKPSLMQFLRVVILHNKKVKCSIPRTR